MQKLTLGLILNGSGNELLEFKKELENIVVSKGLRIIYSKTTPKRLFILEDEYHGQQGGKA